MGHTPTLDRTPAQFFFEVGFGAAYAEALIKNDMKPPFEYSDALVERAWEIAGEAHDDPQEFDHYLAMANATEALEQGVVRELVEAARGLLGAASECAAFLAEEDWPQTAETLDRYTTQMNAVLAKIGKI